MHYITQSVNSSVPSLYCSVTVYILLWFEEDP